MFEDSVQGLADDLELVAEKMKSIVQSMDDHLGPVKEDAHMAGLVGVMDDLVADVEEFAVRANRLTKTKSNAAAPAVPKQKARAA